LSDFLGSKTIQTRERFGGFHALRRPATRLIVYSYLRLD
jgi:hypothetical protein